LPQLFVVLCGLLPICVSPFATIGAVLFRLFLPHFCHVFIMPPPICGGIIKTSQTAGGSSINGMDLAAFA
jgi:hypothetical protein